MSTALAYAFTPALALSLLAAAGLETVLAAHEWQVVDPDPAAAPGPLGAGFTREAAALDAMPAALREGYVTSAQLAALDAAPSPAPCGGCGGAGSRSADLRACGDCGGTGTARRGARS